MDNQLRQIIEEAWNDRALLAESRVREAVRAVIEELDKGRLRTAEPIDPSRSQWQVNEWVKKAILLYFPMQEMRTMRAGELEWHDKMDLKHGYEELGVRVVPHAVARYGAYISPGAILMPSYVNIGAWVGAGTMVDTWATVGSCAQVGERVHLSGGVGVGGVLEPVQAAPVIIEDDYDSEFRFDTRPLPSLQGMAGADGPVVYLSTCSRSLAPSIRIAYMVLPEQLLPAWHAKYALYSGTVSRFEQQTLARFITGGYFTRHLARERVAYKARRDALTKALREAFAPEELHLTGLHTGLHLLAKLRDPPPDDDLRAAAEAEGVRLSLLSDYDLTGGGTALGGTLVLGYGSLADESCASVGETLKRACTAAWESSVRV